MPIGYDKDRKDVVMKMAQMIEPVHIQRRCAMSAFLTGTLDKAGLVIALKAVSKKYEEVAKFLENDGSGHDKA